MMMRMRTANWVRMIMMSMLETTKLSTRKRFAFGGIFPDHWLDSQYFFGFITFNWYRFTLIFLFYIIINFRFAFLNTCGCMNYWVVFKRLGLCSFFLLYLIDLFSMIWLRMCMCFFFVSVFEGLFHMYIGHIDLFLMSPYTDLFLVMILHVY